MSRFLLICLPVLAPFLGEAQVQYGFKAGFQMAGRITDVNFPIPPDEARPKYTPAFLIGGSFLYDFTDKFSLGAGLELNLKGYRIDDEILGNKLEFRSQPLYLQLPVCFRYRLSEVYLGLGPYAALAVGGKDKTTIAEDEESVKIEFGETPEFGYPKYDAGLGVELGFHSRLNNFSTAMFYQAGFVDIFVRGFSPPSNNRARHSVFGIVMNYWLKPDPNKKRYPALK